MITQWKERKNGKREVKSVERQVQRVGKVNKKINIDSFVHALRFTPDILFRWHRNCIKKSWNNLNFKPFKE